ncbi:hypothetical protein PG988_007422 [Apiospora saccharicola]
MVAFTVFGAVLALASIVYAQCGSGTPDAKVTGSGNSFTATRGSNTVYSGGDYRAAIQAALDSISSGQRVAVMASGSIGASTLTISSGKTFEGCGTINTGWNSGKGAIESLNTNGVKIPYLTMTGGPYFGLRFHGVRDLTLGQIVMNLDTGLGIRFDRDAPWNYNVKMDSVRVTGAGTFNIDGLEIGQVVARNIGESGLLIQTSRNVHVGLVDGDNVAKGTGYATLRFANNNGQNANGNYNTNVYVDKVSGGAVITTVDLANNGNNAVLIENCYNLSIRGGTVNGGGEVRLSARNEFPNNRDIWITLTVNGASVRESPCGQNVNWSLSGTGARNIC